MSLIKLLTESTDRMQLAQKLRGKKYNQIYIGDKLDNGYGNEVEVKGIPDGELDDEIVVNVEDHGNDKIEFDSIYLPDYLRGIGFGYQLFKAVIYQFDKVFYYKRNASGDTAKVLEKLKRDPDLEVTETNNTVTLTWK